MDVRAYLHAWFYVCPDVSMQLDWFLSTGDLTQRHRENLDIQLPKVYMLPIPKNTTEHLSLTFCFHTVKLKYM